MADNPASLFFLRLQPWHLHLFFMIIAPKALGIIIIPIDLGLHLIYPSRPYRLPSQQWLLYPDNRQDLASDTVCFVRVKPRLFRAVSFTARMDDDSFLKSIVGR